MTGCWRKGERLLLGLQAEKKNISVIGGIGVSLIRLKPKTRLNILSKMKITK